MGTPIQLFGIGMKSKSPYVTAKSLQNLYCEVRPDGEKSSLVAYGTPGLSAPLVDFGATQIRGGRSMDALSLTFTVHRGVLWEFNNAGVATNRGTLLTTTGRVSMSDNGVQLMIVDGSYGYIYNTSTNVFTQNVTVALAPTVSGPVTVTYLGRRFICNFSAGATGRFYCSNVDNGLVWDPLNFANAEVNPDPILAVWTVNGQLMLAGTETTEFWGLSGTVDFPFSFIAGTAIGWGLVSPWSLAQYGNTVAGVWRNKLGQCLVGKVESYDIKPMSTPDLASIINAYATTGDATAYSYMLGMHQMYVVSFPSAGYTWMFDGSTSLWQPLKSYGLTRYRIEFAFEFLGGILMADYNVGRIYRLAPTTYSDNGDSIEREIVGETLRTQDGSFLDASCLRLDMEVGDGLTSGQGSDPQISLSISRDNGKTWGPEMWKSIGKTGEYSARVEWRRLGTARQLTPKIRMTDPVPICIVSACLNPAN